MKFQKKIPNSKMDEIATLLPNPEMVSLHFLMNVPNLDE